MSRISLGLCIAVLLASCSSGGEPVPTVTTSKHFDLRSSYDEGGVIAPAYTCDGDGQSPPLSWSPPNGHVDEYALTMIDPDAPGGDFVHWVVFGVDAGITSFDAAGPGHDLPVGVAGTNDFGDVGYGGPCPPGDDDPHRYVVTVYALEGHPTADLDDGATARDLIEAIECCVAATGTLTATYDRP